MEIYRILIIAGDPLTRAGLVAVLTMDEHIEISGVGENGDSIDDLIELFRPTAVVWDPGWEQPELVPPDWRDNHLPLVVLLSQESAVQGWLQAGASAVLSRQITAPVVRAALAAAALDLVTIEGSFAIQPADTGRAIFNRPTTPLTGRESEILSYLAEGLTNKAIAVALGISPHTVKFHVTGILTKLDVQSRTEAVSVASRAGLLD